MKQTVWINLPNCFKNLLNRCLYARNVLRFHQEKYDMDMDMCRTCDSYLKKNKILPQAVCNKLSIQTFPCQLKYLNRFESVLMSRRMLPLLPKDVFQSLNVQSLTYLLKQMT